MIKSIARLNVLTQLAIYSLLTLVILTLGDYTVRAAIDNVRTVRLKNYSFKGMEYIDSEILSLQNEIASIEKRVNAANARTYPSITDIKELSREFGLRLDKMEMVNSPSFGPPGLRHYNTTFHGTVGSLVRFLRKLETNYVFFSQTVTLYPVDDLGTVVGLHVSLLISESE